MVATNPNGTTLMGEMKDYDLHIKGQDFRIAELINEAAQEQLHARKLAIELKQAHDMIARLTSHISILEKTFTAMCGELHALRIDTQ